MVIFSGKLHKIRYKKRKGISYYQFEAKPEKGEMLKAEFEVEQIRKLLKITTGADIVGTRLEIRTIRKKK